MNKNQAIAFKVPKSADQALLVQIDEVPYFYSHLHYHPELQLIAIVKGEGILYAGNNMSSFNEKDVFIVGSNVPHLLKCSNKYYLDHSLGVKGVSLFFNESSFGEQFFQLQEMQYFRALLHESKQVIKVNGELKAQIFNKIVSTPKFYNEELVITFLQILFLLKKAAKTYINSEQYSLTLNPEEGGRLNNVLDFTFQNYNKDITINQVAHIAFLSRSQFSYFFKRHTGKTYIQFLNELRIENACNLLKNNIATIEQICYDVGFKNVSNFTRHFKKLRGTTPSNYRKSWMETKALL